MPGHKWDEATLYKERHNMNECGPAMVLVTLSVQIWEGSSDLARELNQYWKLKR